MPILWPRYMLYSSFTIFLGIYGLPTLAHIFSWRLKCERNVFTAVRLEKKGWIHGVCKNSFAIKLNQFLLHVSCSHLYLSIILVQLVVVLNGDNSESLFITSKIYSSLSLHQTVSMVTPQGKLHVKMIRYSGKFLKRTTGKVSWSILKARHQLISTSVDSLRARAKIVCAKTSSTTLCPLLDTYSTSGKNFVKSKNE